MNFSFDFAGSKISLKEYITPEEKEHCVYRLVEAEHTKLWSLESLELNLGALTDAKEIEMVLYKHADSRASYFQLVQQEIQATKIINKDLSTYSAFVFGISDLLVSESE